METSGRPREVKEGYSAVTLAAGDVTLGVWTNRPEGPTDNARPIVFLHGFPDDHHTWRHQLAAFADRPVAAPDLRGVGRSSAPDDRSAYDTEHLLADLRVVIDHIAGPDGVVDLVGHDWGTLIGWRAVSDADLAARIRSFVAISCPHPDALMPLAAGLLRHPTPRNLATFFGQLRKSWYVFWFQVPALPEAGFRSAPGSWRKTLRAAGIAEGDPLLDRTDEEISGLMVNAVNLYRRLARSWLRAPALPEVHAPVRVIAGRDDLALSPRVFDNVPDFAPDAEVHILPANHWVHYTHPAAVNALIEEWVR